MTNIIEEISLLMQQLKGVKEETTRIREIVSEISSLEARVDKDYQGARKKLDKLRDSKGGYKTLAETIKRYNSGLYQASKNGEVDGYLRLVNQVREAAKFGGIAINMSLFQVTVSELLSSVYIQAIKIESEKGLQEQEMVQIANLFGTTLSSDLANQLLLSEVQTKRDFDNLVQTTVLRVVGTISALYQNNIRILVEYKK